MRKLITLIIIPAILLFSIIIFAAPPVINKNVTVISKSSPAQCTSSLRTRIGSDIMTTYSGMGEQDDESAPGVRSCTGCSIQEGDCVCSTCYDYFDNL